MPITTDYDTFAERYHAPSEIEKLKSQVVALEAEHARLTAEKEKLFKFITGGGEVEDVEEIIKEKMSKVFIDINQEHWDQMELFQEEGPRSGNVINTLKEEVDRLEKYNDDYKSEWEDALATGEEYKAEVEKLKEARTATANFWECLMDCRGNPDNPDKQEIDEWCDSYKQSDKVRVGLYQSAGVDED